MADRQALELRDAPQDLRTGDHKDIAAGGAMGDDPLIVAMRLANAIRAAVYGRPVEGQGKLVGQRHHG